jgi:hypothetical protein
VLVSSTVKDLVAGSGLAFQDRGMYELKGVPEEWRLYAISTLRRRASRRPRGPRRTGADAGDPDPGETGPSRLFAVSVVRAAGPRAALIRV